MIDYSELVGDWFLGERDSPLMKYSIVDKRSRGGIIVEIEDLEDREIYQCCETRIEGDSLYFSYYIPITNRMVKMKLRPETKDRACCGYFYIFESVYENLNADKKGSWVGNWVSQNSDVDDNEVEIKIDGESLQVWVDTHLVNLERVLAVDIRHNKSSISFVLKTGKKYIDGQYTLVRRRDDRAEGVFTSVLSEHILWKRVLGEAHVTQ